MSTPSKGPLPRTRFTQLLNRNRAARHRPEGTPHHSASTRRPPPTSGTSNRPHTAPGGSSISRTDRDAARTPSESDEHVTQQPGYSPSSTGSRNSGQPQDESAEDPFTLFGDQQEDRSRKRSKQHDVLEIVEQMHEDLRTRQINSSLEKWHKATRGTAPMLSPFLHGNLAFSHGLDVQSSSLEDEDEEENRLAQLEPNSVLDEDDIAEFKFQCKYILKVMPCLKTDIDDLLEDPEALRTYGKYITSRAAAMRGDHIGALKAERVMKYIVSIPGPHYASRPGGILHDIRKADRGWYHAISGRLLCPLDQLGEYDQDPTQFCTDVRNGNRVITADDYPSFLYDLAEVRDGDDTAGFLQGQFLEKVARTLFTGPSSADESDGFTGKRPGRPPFAHTYKLTRTEPRMIIYAALLARHALNAQDNWGRVDISFDGPMFVKMLLIPFQDEDWKRQILAWWDKKLFSHIQAAGAVNGGKPRPNSMAARLAAKVASANRTSDP